jgi:ABC-type Mn2+/Zn2+ transport system permease subunit
MMLLSILIGVASTVGGLLLSYELTTASGATIVLLSTLIFFVSALLSPRRWRRRPSLAENAVPPEATV